jgi:phage/plasmid-like protein (TIGR03299 family)
MTSPVWGGMAGDPYESKQDVGMLNRQTLIGMTEERGDAWHRRDDLQGTEDNHYPGHIPLGDVIRRLFDWQPVRADVAYLVPLGPGEAANLQTVLMDGQQFRVVRTQADRIGVLHSKTDYDLGVFKTTALHPPYQETLISQAEKLIGTTLGISTAGCLDQGQRAWVEFSVPETLHDPKSGLGYRPNLVHADSMDGSISYTKMLTVEATVCGNTLRTNLLEAKESGFLTRRKHTSGVLDPRKDQDERAALGLLEQVDEQFLADWHKLVETPVTKDRVIEVLDIIKPVPAEKGRGQTIATNWRDQWMAVYEHDPMCRDWFGTAAGVFQADNTWRHHFDPRKGGNRWATNTWRTITGKAAEADRDIVAAMESVLA